MTLFSFIRLISDKLLKYIAGFFGVIGVVLWAYLSGRKSRQRQLEKDNANTNKGIFEESTKSPKSKDDLTKRIREKGL